MTKPLKLTLQITGEIQEEKKFEVIGYLEAKIQEVLKTRETRSFTFGETDVTHTPSLERCVRIILLCSEIGGLNPLELATIMHSLAESEVVAGEYGFAFPSPNCAKLTPVVEAA